MKMDIKKYKSPLLVIVICFIAFFVNNDVIVPDIMESRNIVTAREMVYDGHWIVSLAGALTIVIYALIRHDIVLIVGQSFGFVAYTRNLMLLRK